MCTLALLPPLLPLAARALASNQFCATEPTDPTRRSCRWRSRRLCRPLQHKTCAMRKNKLAWGIGTFMVGMGMVVGMVVGILAGTPNAEWCFPRSMIGQNAIRAAA